MFFKKREKEYLMKLIQFLSFLKNLKGYRKFFFDEAYYLIEFDVVEFLNFLKVVDVSKGKRQNRFIQTLDFLKSLQKLDPMITNFSETFFRSCVIFPYLSVEKKGKFWRVRIAILESLYKYIYPFSFPHSLLLYKNVYELEVKFELIRSMSQISLKKTFLTRDILERCSISNKNKAKVKKFILDSFSILIEEKIISPDFEIINNKRACSLVKFNELTPLLIGKSNKIIFYENINARM